MDVNVGATRAYLENSLVASICLVFPLSVIPLSGPINVGVTRTYLENSAYLRRFVGPFPPVRPSV